MLPAQLSLSFKCTSQDLAYVECDIGPLINLGTQHDGRSARTWMKRVLTTFVSLWEGKKDLLESTKIDF